MGFFKKLVSGLSKTRNNIVSGLNSIFHGFSKIDEDFYEELEETLIMGDIGVETTEKIIDGLRQKVREDKIKDPQLCKDILIDSIKEQMDLGENAYEFENRRSVILVIGVNGVGKTTSIGKIAAGLKKQGKKVILAAADTFRAAAIEQLEEWAKRASVDIIAQNEGSDPGAVVFDALQAAKSRNADVLICDTAGRLHNKKNLMDELRKIDKIITREFPDAYRENLIVLDATTGQNALQQAKEFMCVMYQELYLPKWTEPQKEELQLRYSRSIIYLLSILVLVNRLKICRNLILMNLSMHFLKLKKIYLMKNKEKKNDRRINS